MACLLHSDSGHFLFKVKMTSTSVRFCKCVNGRKEGHNPKVAVDEEMHMHLCFQKNMLKRMLL